METQKPKKKPTKVDEMSKEQIRQAIIKKRECNAKAQQIVEKLLEKGITDHNFLECLPDINQSHMEDIIEERAITKLCGYPICQKSLSETEIPKQKYKISIKTNKVYDITARKSFCSNNCYQSAMYVKKQMLTSPLWFREYEEMPKFKLLQLNNTGSVGQEIDVSLVQRISIKQKKEPFSSINDFASASLNDMTETETTNETNDFKANLNEHQEQSEKTEVQDIDINKTSIAEVIKENIDSNTNKPVPIQPMKPEEPQATQETNKPVTPVNKPKSNLFNIVGDIIEKPEKKIDPILVNSPFKQAESGTKKLPHKKQPLVTVLTIEVEKCLAEWFTIDTLLYLFGEEKVKEMVADKGECIKEYLNNYAKSIFYSSNSYDQYQALCRKLNMLELEDRRLDAQSISRETKPLPDYSILQEESKRLQLKVKAFYTGETVVPEAVAPEKSAQTDEDNLTQLPLVDKHAQNALRRRIVCEHLNKVLPDILRSLGLLSLSISSDVRMIINTFKLKANNIMFKPIQWTLIAIIIIKLLSIRDRRLELLLGQQTAYQHMQLLILSYKQEGGYLDRLLSWLTDIDRLLDTNDTQFTIE